MFDGFWMQTGVPDPGQRLRLRRSRHQASAHATHRPHERALVHHFAQGRRAACARANRLRCGASLSTVARDCRSRLQAPTAGSRLARSGARSRPREIFIPGIHIWFRCRLAGRSELRARAWNRSGQSQPLEALWQPGRLQRNVGRAGKASTRYEGDDETLSGYCGADAGGAGRDRSGQPRRSRLENR